MKLKSMPRELFVEILDYLADHEHFEGLDKVLDSGHSVEDVRSSFRELSLYFRRKMEEEKEAGNVPDYQKDARISSKAKDILSVLSPGDERKLLTRFGLLED
jgi:hypothetical protein